MHVDFDHAVVGGADADLDPPAGDRWLTGIALVYVAYDGWANLPGIFWVKLAFVVVLSLLSLRMNLYLSELF